MIGTFTPTPLAILLIEDNPEDAIRIHQIIAEAEPEGITVRLERTLAAGIAAAASLSFDTVLLNPNLSDSSGVAALERMAAAAPAIPVIILAGNPHEVDIRQAIHGQASDCLIKSDVTGKGIIRAIRNACERKRLQAEQEHLLAILDASHSEISLLDHDTFRIAYANRPFCRNLGYHLDHLRCMTPAAFTIDCTPERLRQTLTPLLDKQTETLALRSHHRRADGTTYPVEVHIQHVNSGARHYLLCVTHDISDRITREQELEEANNRLRQALTDNELLLKEVHHRIKNNLALVASLLNLETTLIHDTRDAELLREARSRVMTMARIHETLSATPSRDAVNAVEYLDGIANQVISSTAGSTISLAVDGDDFTLASGRAVPLGLIVNELVTNSIKHAFSNRNENMIAIHIYRHGKECLLTFRDNGVGLPGELEADTSRNMGLSLVKALVRQLQGTMQMATDNGTRFDLRFSVG